MESAPYIVFGIVVVLFATLVWRLRAPRQGGGGGDAAEIDALQREQDQAVTGTAGLNDPANMRRYRTGDESRRPPRR